MSKTIIIIAAPQVSEHLAQMPFYRELRNKYPKRSIEIWCHQQIIPFLFSGSYDKARVIDHFLPGGFQYLRRLAKELQVVGRRRRDIEQVFIFGNRELYEPLFRYLRISTLVPVRQAHKHRAQAAFDLLQSNGVNILGTGWGTAQSDHLLDLKKIKQIPIIGRPYWVLSPGSSTESRAWSGDEWRKLVRLIQDFNPEVRAMSTVVVGSGEEIEWLKSAASLDDLKMEDRVALGSLPSYSDLLKGARFVVGLDQDWTHFSAFLGIPTHIVWGAGDLVWSGPVGPRPVGLSFHGVACWPCELNQCSQAGEMRQICTRSQSASRVFEEIKNGIFRSLFDSQSDSADRSSD